MSMARKKPPRIAPAAAFNASWQNHKTNDREREEISMRALMGPLFLTTPLASLATTYSPKS
jgi:hypothetical protein